MQSHQVDHNPTNAELLAAIQQFANYVAENVAMKEDLKNELAGYATKQDLEKFATKQELSRELTKFATKEDLDVFMTKVEFDEFYQEFLTSQDSIVTKLDRIEQDHVFAIQWLKRHNETLDRHDAVIHEMKFQFSS